MKSNLEYCIKCQKEQIERASKLGEVSDEIKQEALKYSEDHILGVPAHEGTVFHRMIMEKAGRNPFAEEKQIGIEAAAGILKLIEPTLKTLKDFAKAAVAGNFVDVITIKKLEDVLEEIKKEFNIELAIDDFDKAKKYFQKGKKILYLTDNCGEHLFDLLFIKKLSELGVEVIVAGKDSDITNDATVTDLQEAGFEKYCKVISCGSNCIGTNLNESSEEFLNYFNTVDLIIAKGMGHYECLNDDPHRILYMLKAKCEPVAIDLGVEKDQNVLKFKEKEKK